MLAWRYHTSIGMRYLKDQEKADYWLRRAAEQKYADAQIALETRYFSNLPAWNKTNAEAAPGLEKLATEGDAVMQYKIGMLYLEHGNNVDARRWLRRAADRGEAAGENALRQLDAQQRHTAGLQRKAEAGDAEAQYLLGERHYSGALGLPQDKTAAREWLEKAAAQGERRIQFNVGWCYYLHEDYAAARRWLQIVARGDDSYAKMAAPLLESIDAKQNITAEKTP